MKAGWYVLNYITGEWYRGNGTTSQNIMEAFRYESYDSAATSEAFRRVQHTQIIRINPANTH